MCACVPVCLCACVYVCVCVCVCVCVTEVLVVTNSNAVSCTTSRYVSKYFVCTFALSNADLVERVIITDAEVSLMPGL